MTNIRIEYLRLLPRVTFMKRRDTPGGNEITSRGFKSTCSMRPFSFSQLARQVPVMAMKVSLVSWLWNIGPRPGKARQYPRLKPSEILIAARREALSPTGEVTAPRFSPFGG